MSKEVIQTSLSVNLIVNRGISHEAVRHRIASFAQESTRYCNYDKDKFGNEISVIDLAYGMNHCSKPIPPMSAIKILDYWESAMEYAEARYLEMINLGAPPEIARSVLPSSTKTELVITTNYREWRNIFKLRTASDAHPQIREVMIPLLKELKSKLPVIFDDISIRDNRGESS